MTKIDTNGKPVVVCNTCGQSSTFLVIRPILAKEKRKTWKRVIKPGIARQDFSKDTEVEMPEEKNVMFMDNQAVFHYTKHIYFAPSMIDCYAKKHKLDVKTEPFSRKNVERMNYRKVNR